MADKSSSFTALLTSALCLSDDMLIGRKGGMEGGREREKEGRGKGGRDLQLIFNPLHDVTGKGKFSTH